MLFRSVRVDLLRVTLFTYIIAEETMHVQFAMNPPSDVVAVIVALPALIAMTCPLLSTDATFKSLLFHAMPWFVAVDLPFESTGLITALSCSVYPAVIIRAVVFSVTPVAFTAEAVTVQTHEAMNPPSADVAFIVAVPAAMPLTSPVLSTDAIPLFVLVHVRVQIGRAHV